MSSLITVEFLQNLDDVDSLYCLAVTYRNGETAELGMHERDVAPSLAHFLIAPRSEHTPNIIDACFAGSFAESRDRLFELRQLRQTK